MRRVMILVLGMVVVACGGGSATATGGTGAGATAEAGATGDPGAEEPTQEQPSVEAGGASGFDGSPSGARVRIFNAYTDPVGTGLALDLYPVAFTTEPTTPLLTVPYGELSPVFDPLKLDDAGNSFLTAYVSGEFGNGNSVMAVTNTLMGTEVITYLVARGSGEMGNGRAGSVSQGFYDPSAGNSLQPPPSAGKGRVTLSAAGLDETMAEDPSWNVSFGDGCALGPQDSEYSLQLVSPGTSGAEFELDPGTYTMSLHPYVDGELPTCKNASAFDVKVDVEAGKDAVVFLYATTPDKLQAAVIPLSAP
jgi:hypothetical protein